MSCAHSKRSKPSCVTLQVTLLVASCLWVVSRCLSSGKIHGKSWWKTMENWCKSSIAIFHDHIIPYIVSSYPIWFQFYSSNNLILLFRELWDAMIFVKLLWANDIQSINSIWVCRTRMRVLFTSTNDFHPSLMVARASWLRRDLHMASCIRRCFNRLNPHEFP